MSSSNGAVLVIDDNDANIAVYDKIIREVRGVEPKCFTDVPEALAWTLQVRPVLAIVDYRMPGIDGFEFIKRMRLNPGCNSVPIVMLTGVDDEQVRMRALALGVYEFMRKPIDKRRLQNTITFALRVRLIETHDVTKASL